MIGVSVFLKVALGKNRRTLHWRTILKDLQLPLGDSELGKAATKTDRELRKDKHDGFVQTFEPGEMNGEFAIENALLIGIAPFACHNTILGS
jgi:hypothetical protein